MIVNFESLSSGWAALRKNHPGTGWETVSTIHLWDGQNIVAEIGTTGSVTARYLRGINLIAREQDSALQYYTFNAHGDVTQRYDAN